jgi:hypothetical protein
MLGALAGWVLLMGCGGGADPREQAPSTTRQELVQTHTFAASADARVEEAQPTRNFGSESLLGADLSPRIESYLRFSLHGLTGTVTRATLRLYASDGTTDGPRVFLTSGGWTEGGLTWSNRSGSGAGMAPLDDKGAIASGTWVEFDVTGGVSGNGELNLAVVGTSGNGADFHSRESSRTDLRPQLVVTVESPLPADCLPQTDTYNRGFGPSEDGDVSQSEPGRNFGGSTALRVDGTPRLESYLKFSLFTEGLAIRQAWLELSAFDSTTDGPRLYPASNDWTEGTLTWNTRPGLLGGPAGNLGAINANTRVTYDVTGLVTAEEEYSFALLPDSANNVDFYSREVVESHLDPLLRLTLESPAFCSFRGAGSGLSRWVRRYGGAGPEVVKAVASHPEGGFVAAGRFGEAVFSEPLEGLALARYTAEGQPLWTRVVATRDVTVTDLTVTPTGHLLVVGQYHNAPDLGAGPLPSAPVVGTWLGGLFIARFTSSGALEWARGFVARGPDGSVQRVVPQQVATDASGSLAVAGGFAGVMNLGGGPLDAGSTSTPGYDLNTGGFLAKFSSEGQHLWSRAFRTQERYNLRATAVSTDAAGNVLAGGLALDATDLGDGPVGEYAPFLAKYSPSGSLLWKRLFSGAAGDVEGIQPQGPDRVAFSANLEGTFTFAGGTHTGGLIPWGGTTGFLGALSSSGADVWIRSVGSPFTLWVGELAVRGNGELTLLGRGEEEFDAGGGPLGFSGGSPYIPTSRPFVARYTADGAHLWSRTFDWGRTLDMALLPDGGVLLGSTLMHQLELDGQRFTPVGESDLLYLKLLP